MAQPKPFEDASDFIYQEIKESFSTWKNNEKVTFTFRLLTDEKGKGTKIPVKNPHQVKTSDEEKEACVMSQFLRVTVKPGQEIRLPSKYDQAIRWVSPRTGEVVGGLCPLLTKVGEENLIVSQAFDYKTAIMHEGAMKAVEAMKKENELREALALIEKQKEAMKPVK
jgi:hypothetical protein